MQAHMEVPLYVSFIALSGQEPNGSLPDPLTGSPLEKGFDRLILAPSVEAVGVKGLFIIVCLLLIVFVCL